jgi:periodic tryptophan protein 1
MEANDEDEENNRDNYPEAFSDSEEEKEDFTIRKTDSIIVTATADNDHSNLEVYIYEHEKSNLFVHHEIILGAYPLCLEWLPEW